MFFILHVVLNNQIIFPQNAHHSYFIPFSLLINLLCFGNLFMRGVVYDFDD